MNATTPPLKIEAVGTFTPPPEPPPTVTDGDTDKKGDD